MNCAASALDGGAFPAILLHFMTLGTTFDRMAKRKVSVTLSEEVAQAAADAAARRGVSLSCWLNAAAERALVLEAGLAAVREWEAEHGELAPEELTWADDILKTSTARVAG